MPRVELEEGREAQEIGAAIVGAWLKALPPKVTTTVTSFETEDTTGGTTNPPEPKLKVTVSGTGSFAAGDVVAFRADAKKGGLTAVKVGTITLGAGSQTFEVLDLDGDSIDYKGVDLTGAAVSKVLDLNELTDDLKVVIGQIVEAEVKIVYDRPNELTVVLPSLPEGVVTRGDLIDYLGEYHRYSQGRHYHDELASAVLFGCR